VSVTVFLAADGARAASRAAVETVIAAPGPATEKAASVTEAGSMASL